MVGIVVDATRMHLTKKHWAELIEALSARAGRTLDELHTRDFYSGNGVFRGIDGSARARIITDIFEWLRDRKHHIVYASVHKKSYFDALSDGRIPAELRTPWRFMGFHLVLAMQKHGKSEKGTKGHTIFVFDNEEREKLRFADLIKQPPEWSDKYYLKDRKKDQLDQVVDTPYFGDSRDVALVQLADFAAFFLRRYAEIKEDLVEPRYADEESRIEGLDRATGWPLHREVVHLS